METFGARLKRIREGGGCHSRNSRTRRDVPYMTIYRAERAINQEPRISVAVKLARALGVTVDYLVGVYDEMDDQAGGWRFGALDRRRGIGVKAVTTAAEVCLCDQARRHYSRTR